MSHFTVAVFTDGTKTLEELLQPYHEFECTGTDDQYIQNVNKLNERKDEYLKEMVNRLQAPDGQLFDPWDARFFRDPTSEEKKDCNLMGSGRCGELAYSSRDWGDGKGYRPKIEFVPKGFTEIEVKTSDVKSFRDFLADDGDDKILIGDEPPGEDHKYGWVRVDSAGEVVEVIRRTNPNSKWDWWVIGGRYCDQLITKTGKNGNTFPCAELDYAAMSARQERPFHTWALVAPDGQWQAKGSMGWWGANDATADSGAAFTKLFQDTLGEGNCQRLDCHCR